MNIKPGYIITASGIRFYPLNPTVDMVELNDIAHSLSKMARWTAHTKGDDPYSVAQHAVYASYMVPEVDALEALHHDSSEAYLVDVARPLKYSPGFKEYYMAAEEQITRVIYEKFGIPYTGAMSPSVKEADDRMLATEARDIMPTPIDGEPLFEPQWNVKPYERHIRRMWEPRFAKFRFIVRHNELMRLRDSRYKN